MLVVAPQFLSSMETRNATIPKISIRVCFVKTPLAYFPVEPMSLSKTSSWLDSTIFSGYLSPSIRL